MIHVFTPLKTNMEATQMEIWKMSLSFQRGDFQLSGSSWSGKVGFCSEPDATFAEKRYHSIPKRPVYLVYYKQIMSNLDLLCV